MTQVIEILRIIVGIIIVLVLPGLTLSFVFFPRGKIDAIERLALTLALSLAVVPLLAFYANLVGIPITYESVLVEVVIIVITAGVIAYIRDRRIRKKKQ